MTSQTTGYIYAVVAFVIFSCQDAVSKHLGGIYPPVVITMIRYWVFACFTVAMAMRSGGGIAACIRSHRPWLQVFRGLLLAVQIITTILSFAIAGLAHSQAIFSAAPLIVAALSGPILGERVGWRRWLAILVGFCGVLIILKPQTGLFDATLVIPVINAILLALYALVTRLAGRTDTSMTSFFYIGTVGAVALSIVGPFYWTPIAPQDWIWMAVLCATGMASHYCLIRAYEHLDAVLVQPISYLQLVLACAIGVTLFGETLHVHVIAGSLVVVAAGLFTIWREALARRRLLLPKA